MESAIVIKFEPNEKEGSYNICIGFGQQLNDMHKITIIANKFTDMLVKNYLEEGFVFALMITNKPFIEIYFDDEEFEVRSPFTKMLMAIPEVRECIGELMAEFFLQMANKEKPIKPIKKVPVKGNVIDFRCKELQ